MNWGNYLFGFQGRINRAKIWLFVLIAIVVYIVYFTAVAVVFGGSIVAMVKGGPAGMMAGGATIGAAALASILLYLIVLYCGIAVSVKRLHDRNKSAWWIVVFIVIPIVLSWINLATMLSAMNAGANAAAPNPMMSLVGVASLILSIWGFVELYCLRGTEGPNAYGPDPLAGESAA
ncbi:MAG: DUF805 domain-containing protein [Alphaproteobacteria bacterium]|nr:DUF805 domain-containing protein [Alphaproteobacteria bacterium]MBV9695044.1 DUF805 domain-containing protein [Alphaproteobacteria bacterium]